MSIDEKLAAFARDKGFDIKALEAEIKEKQAAPPTGYAPWDAKKPLEIKALQDRVDRHKIIKQHAEKGVYAYYTDEVATQMNPRHQELHGEAYKASPGALVPLNGQGQPESIM